MVAGPLLIGAAILAEIAERREPDGLIDTSYTLLIFGTLLLVAGLSGLQADQREQAGQLGALGFVLLVIGLLLGGALGRGYLLAGLPFAVLGSALFGLARLRAGLSPRTPALGLAVGVPLIALAGFAYALATDSGVGLMLYGAVFPLPFMWLGFSHWRRHQ